LKASKQREVFEMGRFLTIADLMAQTGFSKSFLHAEIKRGNLQTAKIGRKRMVSHGAAAAWLSGKPLDRAPAKSEPTPTAEPEKAPDLMAVLGRLDRMIDILEDIRARAGDGAR
jgi:hypothetical protein